MPLSQRKTVRECNLKLIWRKMLSIKVILSTEFQKKKNFFFQQSNYSAGISSCVNIRRSYTWELTIFDEITWNFEDTFSLKNQRDSRNSKDCKITNWVKVNSHAIRFFCHHYCRKTGSTCSDLHHIYNYKLTWILTRGSGLHFRQFDWKRLLLQNTQMPKHYNQMLGRRKPGRWS